VIPFFRKIIETAGRPAIREVFGSNISESRPTCGMGNAFMRNAPMALSQNKECPIEDIINKAILS